MFQYFPVEGFQKDLYVRDGVLVGLFFMIDIIFLEVKNNKKEYMKIISLV
jgi:hypothetical protein